MLENSRNCIVDTLTRSEILDLYFVTTDLVDIPMTEAERTESAYYDAMATQTVEQIAGNAKSNIDDLELISSFYVLPHHFWIGRGKENIR